MTTDKQEELVTVNIDGADIDVPKGITMIEAAALAKKEVPHYCYHPKLSVSGNCRMCLVEMGMPMRDRATGEAILDENGVQKIGWMPKPAIACNSKVSPGLHIKTDSKMVKDSQNGVMEFLLVNHPLDCPICDQAGECRLQEFSTDYGRGYSRFVEEKNVKPKRTKLGPRVMLDDERCILCSRCIRFSKEIAKDDVLGFIDRGSYSTLTCYPGKQLENNYSLNTVDICPVGALTSTDFRFKMRVWFLKEVNSICTESSVGVNTVVWSREGKIYRVTPRRNDEVNDTWMSDSGRALYKQVEADNRLTEASIDGQSAKLGDAIAKAVELLQGGKVAVVGSGQSSVEEQYFLQQITSKLEAKAELVARLGEGDELLISTDRHPNVRGALATKLISEYPAEKLTDLAAQIDAGSVNTLLVTEENLAEAGLSEEQLQKVKIVYLGVHHHATAEAASVVLPGLTVFEKAGSFINQQYRLQKFSQVVPGPAGVLNNMVVLNRLLSGLKGEAEPSLSLATLWSSLSAEQSIFSGISYASLPDLGQVLDAGELANLSYPEGKTLHFEPALATA